MKNLFDFWSSAKSTAWRRLGIVCTVLMFCSAPFNAARAQTTVNIAKVPLLALKSAPGLVMLTMSRDHRLFYAAYDDTSDIDGDGTVDVGFKPSITYYGNFISDRCYDYITTGANNPLFRPVAMASASGCKVGSTQRWHGNWLNWATTSRMDALRRVLYGGYRVVDNATTSGGTSTVLQGAFIPKDSHVWGKEYRPVAAGGLDTYLIEQYTTLAAPTGTNQHVFVVLTPAANTTYAFMSATPAPVLRYLTDVDKTTHRIWYWASADVAQGIGSSPANFVKGTGANTSETATDLKLRVEACVLIGGAREAGCTGYPSSSPTVWKPTGTLHDYAVNDQLKFGLITGSYEKNYSGGVVRRNITSFNDEIVTATGQFASSNDGIARTIDRLMVHGWGGSQYDCGYKTTANRNQGDCKSWGAPIAEMMYEGLRYFSGKSAATTAFNYGSGASADATMGFPALPTWTNPFRAKASGGSPICSRPVQMVIADPLTSFDSDQLPGTYYSTPTTGYGAALGSNDLAGLNVTTEADAIWTAEALGTRNVYIGQSTSTNYDGNPSAKTASSFSQLRGHAPDETQSEGSYHSASVARFGKVTGIPVGAPTGTPVVATVAATKVDTLAVALGSRTPRIEFANPLGGKVTIVPLSKEVYAANKNPGQYQATGAITGFYYKNYSPTQVTAVVNYSDSDQGTDNETDAQVVYDITLTGNVLNIQMQQLDPYPGGIQSNMGYVISGTGATTDGLYLDTRTNTSSSPNPMAAGLIYYLDTYSPIAVTVPAGVTPTIASQLPKTLTSPLNSKALPTFGTTTSRTFTLTAASANTTSFIPHDPLWYAAKYGGAGVMTGPVGAQDPTNYFKISNPANLPAQMGKAFRSAAALAAVASTSVVGVGQRSLGTAAIYQANYDSLTWSSRLYAFPVSTSGALSNTPVWESSALIPTAPASRTKMFLGRGGATTPIVLASTAYASLSGSADPTTTEINDFGDSATYNYLRGDKSGEERNGGTLRNRGITAGTNTSTAIDPATQTTNNPAGTTYAKSTYGSVLGDIVNSDPQIISKKDYDYGNSDATYTTFFSAISSETIAVGSNDGFFHIFNADPTSSGGGELLAFMPQAARMNIKNMASPAFQHEGKIDGSIGLGHAKIRTPADSTVKWRSLAIGTGGGGAQTVFAVDASSTTFTTGSVMWEINNLTTAASSLASTFGYGSTFGNIMGRPAIGKLADGTWVTVFGNGYNSTAGRAFLYVVRLNDGAILKIIPTNNATTGNGMGATEIVRKTSGNRDTIDYVYGVDYKGGVWRFDLSSVSGGSGWPANGALLYQTPTGRAITGEIKVGPAPTSALTTGGKMVYFGTGSYLSAADPSTTTVQALYGVYDDLLGTSNSTASVLDTKLSNMTISPGTYSDVRKTSAAPTTPWYTVAGNKGWVVPLTASISPSITNIYAGERVIAPPVRYTITGTIDAFLFTSIVPSTDDCSAGLDAWITGVDAMTGGYVKAFSGLGENSVRITGGSPRGVFVLQDGAAPTLYISQTVFNNTVATNTFTTGTGGSQDVTINGVTGTTRIISIDLTKATPSATSNRQVWRQLK